MAREPAGLDEFLNEPSGLDDFLNESPSLGKIAPAEPPELDNFLDEPDDLDIPVNVEAEPMPAISPPGSLRSEFQPPEPPRHEGAVTPEEELRKVPEIPEPELAPAPAASVSVPTEPVGKPVEEAFGEVVPTEPEPLKPLQFPMGFEEAKADIVENEAAKKTPTGPKIRQMTQASWENMKKIMKKDVKGTDLKGRIENLEKIDDEIGLKRAAERGDISSMIEVRMAVLAIGGKIGLFPNADEEIKELKNLRQKFAEATNDDIRQGVLNQVAEMLPPMAKGTALTVFGNLLAPVAGTSLGMTYWGLQGAGSMYDEMTDAGLDPDKALSVAIPAGALYAAIESLQVNRLFGLSKMSKEVLSKTINESLATTISNLGKKFGKNWLIEMSQEELQEIVQLSAFEVGEKLGIPEENHKDFTEELIKSTKGVLEAGPAIALLGGVGGAVETTKVLSERNKLKKEAKLGTTEPTKTPEAVANEVIPEVVTEDDAEVDAETTAPPPSPPVEETPSNTVPDEIIKPLQHLDKKITEAKTPELKEALEDNRSLVEDERLPGVVIEKVFKKSVRKMDEANIPYTYVRWDGRNLTGSNKAKGHPATDKGMEEMWSRVMQKEVEANGGLVTRFGKASDEGGIIFPYKTEAEVEIIMADISAKIDQRVIELGFDKIDHAKLKIPEYGSLGIDYGVAKGRRGKFGEVDTEADNLAIIAKERFEQARAKEKGYILDKEKGIYVKDTKIKTDRADGKGDTGTGVPSSGEKPTTPSKPSGQGSSPAEPEPKTPDITPSSTTPTLFRRGRSDGNWWSDSEDYVTEGFDVTRGHTSRQFKDIKLFEDLGKGRPKLESELATPEELKELGALRRNNPAEMAREKEIIDNILKRNDYEGWVIKEEGEEGKVSKTYYIRSDILKKKPKVSSTTTPVSRTNEVEIPSKIPKAELASRAKAAAKEEKPYLQGDIGEQVAVLTSDGKIRVGELVSKGRAGKWRVKTKGQKAGAWFTPKARLDNIGQIVPDYKKPDWPKKDAVRIGAIRRYLQSTKRSKNTEITGAEIQKFHEENRKIPLPAEKTKTPWPIDDQDERIRDRKEAEDALAGIMKDPLKQELGIDSQTIFAEDAPAIGFEVLTQPFKVYPSETKGAYKGMIKLNHAIRPYSKPFYFNPSDEITIDVGVTQEISVFSPGRDPVLGTPPSQNPKFPKSLKDLTSDKYKMTGSQKVIESIAKIGGVPLRMGKVKRGAMGMFKTRARVIRIRIAQDIYTAAHEAAHAIYEEVLTGHKLTSGEKAELVALGKELYGTKKPVGGYASEGFAEFLAQTITGGPGPAKATNFNKFFQEYLKKNPELAKRVEQASIDARAFANQGSLKRALSHVEFGAAFPKIKNWVKETFSKKKWLDDLDPFSLYDKEVESILGRKLLPSESTFITGTALRHTHDARTRYMTKDAMIDFYGNVVGPPLEEATALVKGKRKEFSVYLLARRALERWAQNKNPGISQEDAEFVFNQLDNPKFQLAAKKVYEWNQGVLDYMVQSDPTIGPIVEKILAGSTNYVPLARMFEDVDPIAFKTYVSKVQGGNPLKHMVGSGRRIRDPFQVMVENAGKILRQSHQRVVINQLLKWRDLKGMGVKIEKIPNAMVPNSVEISNIKKQLEDAGADLSEVEMDEVVTFFTPARQYKGNDPIVPIMEREPVIDAEGNPVVDKNGTPQIRNKTNWYWIDKEIYESLNSLDIYRMPKAFDLMFGVPARTFRMGTTGLRATFSLIRNPARDLPTFLIQTESRKWPLSLMKMWIQQNFAAATAVLPGVKRNPYHELFVRLGAEMSQPLGQDTQQTRRAVKELFKGKVVRILTNPIDHLREILQIPETATRTAELRARAAEVGWTPGQPITLDQSLQLLFDAKRVTTDFGAAGSYARVINQAVPFFNPNIQGARIFGRTLKKKTLIASLKALTIVTLPTLALWWRNKDKEWYRDMRWEDKFGYWNIEGDDEVVRIPRPFEWGNVYGVLPEALMDWWYQEDPKAAVEGLQHIFETTAPSVMPQTVRPIVEQLRNRMFFGDRPIVSHADLQKPYEEQYGPYASQVAKFLGAKLKWSPARIDHLIRGYFGGLGTDVMDVIGLGATKKNTLTKSDIPLLGTLFRRGGVHGTSQAVEDMYDMYAKYRRMTLSRNLEVKYNPATVEKFAHLKAAVTVFQIFNDLIKDEEVKKEKDKLIEEARDIALDVVKTVQNLEAKEKPESEAKK